jgi:transglutaminase-like putative cysteine protease
MRRLALITWLGELCCFAAGGLAGEVDSVLQQAVQLEEAGDFAQADALLSGTLAGAGLSEAQRRQVAFEQERLTRIHKDYGLSKAALFAALQQSVGGLTPARFEQWVREGWFDGRVIDGKLCFVGPSVANLYFRHPEMEARRRKPVDTRAKERAYLENARAIRRAATKERRPYVLPKRFHLTMSVTVASNAVAAGELVRAWLPVPRRYPFQDQFDLLRTSPPKAQIAEPASPIRSAFLEQVAPATAPVLFELEYEYTACGVWFNLEASRARPPDLGEPDLQRYVAEGPHLAFTRRLRELSASVAGRETNPLGKARLFYDWMARNIRYSFAREYSTLRNLSDYCLTNRYGDCGQEALLFMALCRLNGIPARWQSGWTIFPGDQNLHDWCEIYVPPYGWAPVDPYMGIYAMQIARTLKPAERLELRDFYFGGLSQYRLIANSDHCQELSPPKRSFRSDTVDFQRGEVEAGDRNIYFDQFSYKLEWREVPLAPRAK